MSEIVKGVMTGESRIDIRLLVEKVAAQYYGDAYHWEIDFEAVRGEHESSVNTDYTGYVTNLQVTTNFIANYKITPTSQRHDE